MTNTKDLKTKQRESGIELFRIITMLIIVAHHYFVNSGLSKIVYENPTFAINNVFLLIFGWGGKTGINCFVIITGYFMCTSNITLKKYLKLILCVEFYKITILFIFVITGVQDVSFKSVFKSILPITSVKDGFTSAYLCFFLFIPFLNILITNMNKKTHLTLIALCIGIYSILGALPIPVTFNYITWFSVIYVIGAYLRLYPEWWFNKKSIWGIASVFSLILSWCSVIVGLYVYIKYHKNVCYWFISDSNKPLAVITSICSFMFFKNINIGYKKTINRIAASAFGVLLIHANSSTMRQWLWVDTFKNVKFYNSHMLYLHAFGSVCLIYFICTLIDMMRIKCIEIPFLKLYDKKLGRCYK